MAWFWRRFRGEAEVTTKFETRNTKFEMRNAKHEVEEV
jgi:hypothetical protein